MCADLQERYQVDLIGGRFALYGYQACMTVHAALHRRDPELLVPPMTARLVLVQVHRTLLKRRHLLIADFQITHSFFVLINTFNFLKILLFYCTKLIQ